MTTTPQRLLNLRLEAGVSLYRADFVRAIQACDAEEIVSQIDAGELRWAFDLSTGRGEVREIHIWGTCILNPERAAAATLDEVIEDAIGGIPTEPEVRGARLQRRWVVSAQTFRRLRIRGEITGRVAGRTLWINRQSLRGFLARRLIH